MSGETKAALEWLRAESDERLNEYAQRILAHIDGEPARLAAAREEQREACARNMVDAHAHRGPLWPSQLADSIRATPLDATPLADELRTLRARVAELEAAGKELVAYNTEHFERARAEHDRAEKAEAQVSAARAVCERPRPPSRDANDVARDVLRAMDEAAKK